MDEDFDLSKASEQPGGRGGHRAWIAPHENGKHYWAVSLHRSGGEVVRCHGPFSSFLEARNDLKEAQKTKDWPSEYAKY